MGDTFSTADFSGGGDHESAVDRGLVARDAI